MGRDLLDLSAAVFFQLDEVLRQALRSELEKIAKRSRRSFSEVTQDLIEEALRMRKCRRGLRALRNLDCFIFFNDQESLYPK